MIDFVNKKSDNSDKEKQRGQDEMDIGSKIKQSRIESGVTQEDAADKLGVSRQTISNWENEKTYPDIISVLKMSELYKVSLDYLLKGESQMDGYMNYLDESTNVVKSKKKLSKLILILSYLVIWAIAMIVFWCFTSGSDSMGYSLMFLWFILPITTFVVSLLIGINDHFGKMKWCFVLGFGVMHMLAEYATFGLANSIAVGNKNTPEPSLFFAGMIISAIGMGIGCLVYLKRRKK